MASAQADNQGHWSGPKQGSADWRAHTEVKEIGNCCFSCPFGCAAFVLFLDFIVYLKTR